MDSYNTVTIKQDMHIICRVRWGGYQTLGGKALHIQSSNPPELKPAPLV